MKTKTIWCRVAALVYWKVTHMVVSKAQALKCNDCHGEKGRMDWKALGYDRDPQKKG